MIDFCRMLSLDILFFPFAEQLLIQSYVWYVSFPYGIIPRTLHHTCLGGIDLGDSILTPLVYSLLSILHIFAHFCRSTHSIDENIICKCEYPHFLLVKMIKHKSICQL